MQEEILDIQITKLYVHSALKELYENGFFLLREEKKSVVYLLQYLRAFMISHNLNHASIGVMKLQDLIAQSNGQQAAEQVILCLTQMMCPSEKVTFQKLEGLEFRFLSREILGLTLDDRPG